MDRHGVTRLLDRAPAPGAAPPLRRDWILVGVLAVTAVLEGALRSDLLWPAAATVLTVLGLGTLPWRRTHPLVAVGAATIGGSALELTQYAAGLAPTTLYTSAAFVVVPYSLFRWGSGRAVTLGSPLLLVGFTVSIIVAAGGAAEAAVGAMLLILLAVLGESVRYRAAARARFVEQARARERERIARDLHDTVAHSMSAIAVRAQAGQVAAVARPGAAVDALEVIEQVARTALSDMRSVVGALRTGEVAPTRRPSPGLAGLADLARPSSGADPVVVVHGADAVGDVTPGVGAAVYRIAQESVTNARRHARGATRVDVAVEREAGNLRLRVHDDGTPPRVAPARGHGLTGMAERAALLGGRCSAGPDPDGGWTVAVTVPVATVQERA